jgi:hypothetical protein
MTILFINVIQCLKQTGTNHHILATVKEQEM